ncbi:helix-turn-helix domain-containing protein [Ensifer sp. ENS10]|nr:helix-turn-helix domain-containing protein [Ensifer sp. ENS10]
MALVLGFSDQAHFTRAFSQTVGISPAKWRRMRCH